MYTALLCAAFILFSGSGDSLPLRIQMGDKIDFRSTCATSGSTAITTSIDTAIITSINTAITNSIDFY